MKSDPTCSSAGCGYKRDRGKTPYPMDYPVPNFGRDHEINHTWSSLDWAENSLRHRWRVPTKEELKAGEYPMDYPVPDFGLEDDVVVTQKNIANSEKKLKHSWKPSKDENGVYKVPNVASLLQTDEMKTSDPICSSAKWPCGTTKKSPHPVDYKVPNFGVDEDIINTQKHVADQEKKQNHKWTPKQDENGNWSVPEPIKNSSYSYK
jgi:hypothetical protein